MSTSDLTDDEWDRVFELAESCQNRGSAEHASIVQQANLPERMRTALELQLRLGEPSLDPDWNRSGERIGQRIILRKRLRGGGSSDVYLGIRQAGGQYLPVAVKLLRAPMAPELRTSAREAWRREVRLLLELSGSSSIPALVESGEYRARDQGEFFYICTEYKHGLNLRRWCQEHALGSAARIALFLGVCDAVAKIHAHGLVHGDLKPDNIQVQAKGADAIVWVLDLGLAAEQGQSWHSYQQLVGTPGYMSPEQIFDDLGPVSEASDVYALGVTLCEILEDAPPLPRRELTSPQALWDHMRAASAANLRKVEPEALRAELDAICKRATALQPKERYLQVSALRDGLQDALPAARGGAGRDERTVPNGPTRGWAGWSAAITAPPGERKYVTVLVAALEFSEMASSIDAIDRRERALAEMREIIRRHDGAISHATVDGIVSLFGAPIAQEDHAVRASAASLALIQEGPCASDASVRVRVGLHSGEVALQLDDSGELALELLEGEVLQIARGIQALAEPNQALLSFRTFRLAEGYVQAYARSWLELESSPPVQVYQLAASPLVLQSWMVRVARGLTPFVGRDPEFSALLGELERAGEGDPRLIEIVGEPGIGKSRLAHELGARAESLGWQVIRAAALPNDALDSFTTLARVLRAWLRIDEREPQRTATRRLERSAGALLGANFADHQAALRSVLDLPVKDARWELLEPVQRRASIVAATSALTEALANDGSLLLIVDDAHWSDEETLRLIESLSRVVRGRILVVLTYRPERSLVWNIAGSSRIHLGPLSRRGGQLLLDGLMGEDPSLKPLKARLSEHTGGNPLFLEESVRSLADAGVLQGALGALRAERRVEFDVPPSVHGVIASRLDRISPRLKMLLAHASIIGRRFSLDILYPLVKAEPWEVREGVDELIRLGFLLPESGRPEGLYTFKHALIQQVVYLSFPLVARRQVHAQIVSILESSHSDRIGAYLADLCEHCFLAGLWESAARYRLQSCVAAYERSASREVVLMFDRALEALDEMPRSSTILKIAIDLRLILNSVLISLGDHSRLVSLLEEASGLAESIEDERRLGTVYSAFAVELWVAGRYDESLESARRALRLAQRLNNPGMVRGAQMAMGLAYHGLGQYRPMLEVHQESLAHFTEETELRRTGYPGYPTIILRSYLIDGHQELGELDTAESHARMAQSLADRVNHAYSETLLHTSISALRVAQGRAEEAVVLCEQTLSKWPWQEAATMHDFLRMRLAEAYLALGRLAEAERALHPLLQENSYRRGALNTQIVFSRVVAELHLRRQELEAALGWAREAERLARRSHAHGLLARTLGVLAQVETALRNPRMAALALEEGLLRSADLAMTPLHSALLRLGSERG